MAPIVLHKQQPMLIYTPNLSLIAQLWRLLTGLEGRCTCRNLAQNDSRKASVIPIMCVRNPPPAHTWTARKRSSSGEGVRLMLQNSYSCCNTAPLQLNAAAALPTTVTKNVPLPFLVFPPHFFWGAQPKLHTFLDV